MSKTAPIKLALGARVRFSAVLERRLLDTAPGSIGRPRGRHQQHHLPAERAGEGVLVGYRTLSNGFTTYGWEEGNTWHPTGYVRCALVAVSLYRNPVAVPLDALQEVRG